MDIFANDIDLNGNEFKKLRAENLLSLPTATSSDVGRIVMNTGIGKFYGYDGTNWIPFEGGVGGGSPYVLPTATDTLLGGVKIGNNIDIDIDGVISVSDFPVKQNDTLGSLYWDYFRDQSFFGQAGFGSVDFSFSLSPSTVLGPTGQYSFTQGLGVEASGYAAIAFGNSNVSSGTFSWASGYENTNSSYAGFVHGYSNNLTANGYGNIFGIGNDSNTSGGIMAGIALISTGGTKGNASPFMNCGVGLSGVAAGGDCNVASTTVIVNILEI